jgi:hypothetical protein
VTAARLKPESLPGWPRWLTEELAAAYVGLGQDAFRKEVAAGVWPAPRKAGRYGGRNVWDRTRLDEVSDRLSNPATSAKERMLRRAAGNGQGVHQVSA